MKFRDTSAETTQMVWNVCLILSLGAIFLQIWILMSGLESFLEGKYGNVWANLLLSGIALLTCALTAWTTTLDFFKRISSGSPENDKLRG